MEINLIYDASVNAAPAAFKTALTDAALFLDSLITNAITVNIQVGYGEDNGASLGASNLGEGGSGSGPLISYSQLKSDLVANATSATAQQAVSTLPSSNPTGNGVFYVSPAQEKAWGLLSATGSEIDGTVGFSSTAAFDYNPNNRAVAGEYDFIGVAEHELTHALGRTLTSSEYDTLYLYRYSAPGVRQLDNGGAAYFSINGGSTNLDNFDTTSDYADWAKGGGNDSFNAFSNSGVLNGLSPTDITEMNALGFNATGPTLGVNVQNVFVATKSSIAASSLVTSVSNPGGDIITYYSFWDAGGDGGHFTVNGAIQPDGQWIYVSASNLSSIQYVGGASPGSEQLFVGAYDATVGSYSNSVSLTATTTGPNAINNLITELYVGYYNRAPDPSGETYWVGQLQGGLTLSQIAQSYSAQPESTALYPFLASPNTSSTAAIDSFIAAIYENLFGRAPDAAGQTYYVQQLQNGQNTVGGTIIAIESGAQGNDLLVLANKLTVGDYFDTQIFNNNVQFSQSVALAAFAAVTSSASSVTTAEALVNAYVKTAPLISQAATSQTEVNVVGITPSHDSGVGA